MTDVELPQIPWVGSALRHLPAHAERGVLDFQLAGTGGLNRWNSVGTPTLYLAGDPGVLIAEWGRHLDPRFTDDVIGTAFSHRDVYRLRLRLDRVIDLRVEETAVALGLQAFPQDMLDIRRTRMAAQAIRTGTAAQAILVPSVAFLDDLTRWNLVVFLEKVPTATSAWITSVEKIGPLRWQ